MQILFLRMLNMSLTAGWLVLAVILIRSLFKGAPKAFRVILWGLVGIRLMLPFSVESTFSLLPPTETIPMDIVEMGDVLPNHEPEGLPDDGAKETVGAIIGGETEQTGDDVELPENTAPYEPNTPVKHPIQKLVAAGVMLWLSGMAIMTGYAVISYLRIHRKVSEAVPFKDNILLCDHIDTPFILGMIRPRIYLPSAMAESDLVYVIAHEQSHLSRKDHWWKPIGFILLTVYWFHPLLWVAYILLCRDIELACDERVIREMGVDIKKSYSDALINCSVPRKMVTACPLAFGETGVKNRIKSVLNYKKPTFWAVIAAMVISVAVVLCFLTDPAENPLNERLQVLIDCAIASHNQSEKSGENFCCVDWEVLGTERKGNRLTVYLWTFYQEYSYDKGIKEESGSHIPVAITVEKKDGSYITMEYWMPRDGSYWVQDIRDKFPVYLWGKATDSQRYVKEQQAACDRMAEEYFFQNVIGDKEFDLRYEFKYSDDEIKPHILLNSRDRTFRLVFSGYSSCLPEGNYIITQDGILVLLDGTERYRFNRENGVYMFDAEKSSPIPQYNYGGDIGMKTPIPDGAAFQMIKEGLSEEEWNAPPDEKQVQFPVDAIVDGCVVYRYPYSVESMDPCIAFYPDEQKFSFFHSAFSAFLFFGRYEQVGDILTLKMYDIDMVLKFCEVDGNFVFLENESSKLPTYRYAASESKKITSVPDGAVFEVVMPNEKLNVTEPPRLVVVQAHEMIEAAIGNTEWDWELADGTRSHIVACGSTMYENRDRLNVLKLEADEALFVDLQFGTDPNKVTVTCWNLDEENPEPETIEAEDVLWSVDLKDGNYVYEIKAEWTDFPRFNGVVEYGFKTEKVVKSGD